MTRHLGNLNVLQRTDGEYVGDDIAGAVKCGGQLWSTVGGNDSDVTALRQQIAEEELQQFPMVRPAADGDPTSFQASRHKQPRLIPTQHTNDMPTA